MTEAIAGVFALGATEILLSPVVKNGSRKPRTGQKRERWKTTPKATPNTGKPPWGVYPKEL